MIGESTMDAAKRELLEETNISPESCVWYDHPFMTTDAIFKRQEKEKEGNDDDDGKTTSSYEFHYVIAQVFAKTTDQFVHDDIVPDDDALDAKWYTIQDIKEMERKDRISPLVIDVINRADELF